MKKFFALILAICLALCGCNSANSNISEPVQATYVPRSTYSESENYVFNAYTGIDFTLPEKWTIYNDSKSLGQLHNLTDTECSALDDGRWNDITSINYLPDYIIYGEKGGDKISVVYYPVADGVTAESCCESYIEMFRKMNNDIADRRSTHSRMHPLLPPNIIADGNAFESENSSETTLENASERQLDFYTAEIKAEFWGKNAYEYGAFAQIDNEYIIGIMFSTTNDTNVEDFWKTLGF